MINNALCGKSLPLYGDGMQMRDWIYVLDHCKAIDLVTRKGCSGEFIILVDKTNIIIFL